jgi:hypothetical protein
VKNLRASLTVITFPEGKDSGMAMTENKKEVVRCYAKYVYLDVVQFSKRSAEAQSEIVQQLNEIVRQVLNNQKVSFDEDCILIPTGDGMCIAMISPNLPYDTHIQVALGILKLIYDYNKATENETRRFQARVGINQNTDILVTDINGRKNVAGAGINMASRIMDKADGGQILVSQAVFHELQPSEIYMDKFKSFNATGKHNVSFQVHQYISDEHYVLNKDVPNAFATRSPEKKKLNEQTAHYFAQAIMHRQDLLRIKAKLGVYWDSAAVVLLRLLADDSYRISNATEFDGAPTMHTEGSGSKSFDEQYEYYKSNDIWVLRDAESHIVAGDEIKLTQYSEYFEYGDYTRHYEFVNAKGIEKLREEWPAIWELYELDKYV